MHTTTGSHHERRDRRIRWFPVAAVAFAVASAIAVPSASAQTPDPVPVPVATAPSEDAAATALAHNPGANAPADAAQAAPPGRATPQYYDRAIDFTKDLPTPQNVSGSFTGHVAFTQSTYVTPSGNWEEYRPNLIPNRAALMWFFPSDPTQTDITANIGDTTYQLVPPEFQPHHDGTYGTEPIVFTKRAWSVVVNAEDMAPGMSITFVNGQNQTGTIGADDFTFGAPIEQTAIGISVGMLTPEARDIGLLHEGLNAQLSLDYYNRVPFSKYRLVTYEPVVLDRVVLRNGSVLTPDNPGGTVVDEAEQIEMRGQIAKAVIGSGISYANIGVPVAAGAVAEEPRPFRQTTLMFSQGMYVRDDGTKVLRIHANSGGGGQLLIRKFVGNEFSHEFGHDYGMPHPWGELGKQLSIMTFNGGWGYDINRDRMIGNVRWKVPAPDGPLPWEFNTDSMQGGSPFGVVSKYTLYAPDAARRMQRELGRQSGWLDLNSPTGYSGWDETTQRVVPFTPKQQHLPKPLEVGAPTTTIVGYYDPVGRVESWIAPAMHANWGVNYDPLEINEKSGHSDNCTLTVSGNGPDRVFNLADRQLRNTELVRMNQFAVNVPTRFAPTKATVTCFGETRVSLDLKPPAGPLPEVVEVGGDAGMDAVTRIPAQKPDASTTLEGFERNLSNVYGPIRPFVSGTEATQFGLYSYEGNYYQATTPTTVPPPGAGWKFITSSSEVSDTVVEPGEDSRVYSDGNDGYAFTVPADGVEVFESTIEYLPRKAADFEPGPARYGTVTVRGVDRWGNEEPIVLQVQANGEQTPAWRFRQNDETYFTATFDPDDNPDLLGRTFDVDFEVRVTGYWTGVVKDAFRVKGTIKPPPT